MKKKMTFICEYCGLVFDKEAACKKHEEIHTEDFSKKSNKEISARLFLLYSFAENYRIGNTIMGVPTDNFKNLMCEAAKRLREVEDE